MLFQYLNWHFFDVPKNILSAWMNFLKFGLDYFSIPLLLKTLFSPWRRYIWFYPKGFEIRKYLEVAFSNLISRTLGMAMRISLISVGILVEIFIIFAGITIFLGWLILPFLLILGIYYGIRIFF